MIFWGKLNSPFGLLGTIIGFIAGGFVGYLFGSLASFGYSSNAMGWSMIVFGFVGLFTGGYIGNKLWDQRKAAKAARLP